MQNAKGMTKSESPNKCRSSNGEFRKSWVPGQTREENANYCSNAALPARRLKEIVTNCRGSENIRHDFTANAAPIDPASGDF
jgi:hypothetical protein